jgi:hypothetical protein
MQTTRQFRKELDRTLANFLELDSPRTGTVNRFDRVSEALVFVGELVDKLTADRDEALSEVYAYAGSLQSVADATGLSRARVQQIIERHRERKRA